MSRVSGKTYFLYVLWLASVRKFYIGISEDAASRLLQHNSGVSKWSPRHATWEIVHAQDFSQHVLGATQKFRCQVRGLCGNPD
jgi:predicted GIY-YIG superfamily endonuclease